MQLTNGACYKKEDGSAIRVQKGIDGKFYAYDADGNNVAKYKADEHVNGLEPIGYSQFIATKSPPKEKAKAKPKKKEKKKSALVDALEEKDRPSDKTESDDAKIDPS